MESTEEVDSLTVEVGVGYQSSSAELVLDDENDDVEDSCSQGHSQLLVVLNEEAVVVVSSDGVASRLSMMSSQNQALLVKLALEEDVLEAVSAAI